MTTKVVTRYLHGEEDDQSDLWPLDTEQQKVYHYSLYEVRIDLEVEMETGKSRIVAVDGVPLQTVGKFK